LTSHHFINKKSSDILSDLQYENRELNAQLLEYNKFILSCQLLEHAFSVKDFKNQLMKEEIEKKIYQNSKTTSASIATYISAYYSNISHSEKFSNDNKIINNTSVSKLKKIISKNTSKLNHLVSLEMKTSILKSNTANFIADILNKLLHTEQTSLFKVFSNSRSCISK
jgi:predicted AAA+ superfamily ATPase